MADHPSNERTPLPLADEQPGDEAAFELLVAQHLPAWFDGRGDSYRFVVSGSLTADDTAPWTDTTTIVPRAHAHKAVAELKNQPGRDILVLGSRTSGTTRWSPGSSTNCT